MKKLHRSLIGTALAGTMVLTSFGGVINQVDSYTNVYAKEEGDSNELIFAREKIDHLTYSLKHNYLGIKNQAQWELYIKETRNVIETIPRRELVKARELTRTLDKAQELVNAVSRINQVEKSMETNYHGIKNAEQWSEYLELARRSLTLVDQNVYRDQHDSLVVRKDQCQRIVDSITNSFNKEYLLAFKKYEEAKYTMDLDDANNALKAAEALGTCEKSDNLEKDCKKLIEDIKGGQVDVNKLEIEGDTYDYNTSGQRLSIKANNRVSSVDQLEKQGYTVEFTATTLDSKNPNIFKGNSNKSYTGILGTDLDKGLYTVEVSATKGSVKVTSSKAIIMIKDMNPEKTTISGYTILNYGNDKSDKLLVDTDNFTQKSNTLVTGELASISEIKVKTGDGISSISSGYTVTSSNDSVVKVTEEAGNIPIISKKKIILEAKSKGSATITIRYKDMKEQFTIYVKDEKRKINKVNPSNSTISTKLGSNVTLKVDVLDQYSDPIAANIIGVSNDIVTTTSDIADIIGLSNSTLGTKGTSGKAEFTITPKSAGSEKVYFKDKEGNQLGYITIKVSEK